jgi:hypothetical protein
MLRAALGAYWQRVLCQSAKSPTLGLILVVAPWALHAWTNYRDYILPCDECRHSKYELGVAFFAFSICHTYGNNAQLRRVF